MLAGLIICVNLESIRLETLPSGFKDNLWRAIRSNLQSIRVGRGNISRSAVLKEIRVRCPRLTNFSLGVLSRGVDYVSFITSYGEQLLPASITYLDFDKLNLVAEKCPNVRTDFHKRLIYSGSNSNRIISMRKFFDAVIYSTNTVTPDGYGPPYLNPTS